MSVSRVSFVSQFQYCHKYTREYSTVISTRFFIFLRKSFSLRCNNNSPFCEVVNLFLRNCHNKPYSMRVSHAYNPGLSLNGANCWQQGNVDHLRGNLTDSLQGKQNAQRKRKAHDWLTDKQSTSLVEMINHRFGVEDIVLLKRPSERSR